jgi:hypothetical protein
MIIEYTNSLFSNIVLVKSLIYKEFNIYLAKFNLGIWLVVFVPLVTSSPEKTYINSLKWVHLEYRTNIENIFGKNVDYSLYKPQTLRIPDDFPIIEFVAIERSNLGTKYIAKDTRISNFEVLLINDKKRVGEIYQYPAKINFIRAVLTNHFTCTVLNNNDNIVYL